MFFVRLVKADHYMNPPIPGLDTKFSEFRAVEVKQVPVIRIFGSTTKGHKVCLHVHGVFPYIYIPYDGIIDKDKFVYQVASALDKALNVSLGNSNSHTQHVYKISIVSAVPFYGYHSKCHQFLKIYFYNPLMVKRATDLLQNGAILGQVFQPHEAHIPYILQFFIDYNLHGMSYVRLASVRYRQGTLNGSQASDTLPMENVPKELLLPENITRISTCKLEVDAVAADILNRQEIPGQMTKNPGLKAIWDEEIERRRKDLRSSQITPQSSQTRQPCLSISSEIFHLDRLNRHIKEFISLAPQMTSRSSSGKKPKPYPAETPEAENLIEASFLASHVPCLRTASEDVSLALTASVEESTAHTEEPLIDTNVAQSLVYDNLQSSLDETTMNSQCLSLVQVLQDLVEEDSVLGSQGLHTEEIKSTEVDDDGDDIATEDNDVFSQTLEDNESENTWEFDETNTRTLKNTSIGIPNEVGGCEDVIFSIPQLDGANDIQKNGEEQPQLDCSHRRHECTTNCSPSVTQSNIIDSDIVPIGRTVNGNVFEKSDNVKPILSMTLEISDMCDTDSLQSEIFTDNFSLFTLGDPCNTSSSACPSPDLSSTVGYRLDPVSGKTFLESVLIGDPSFTAQPNLSEKDELFDSDPVPPLDETWNEGGSSIWLSSEKCFNENTRSHLSEMEEELCDYGTNELTELPVDKNLIVPSESNVTVETKVDKNFIVHSESNVSSGLSKITMETKVDKNLIVPSESSVTAIETKRRLSSLIKARSKHIDTTENTKTGNAGMNVSGGVRTVPHTNIFGSIDTLTPILQSDELEHLLDETLSNVPCVLMSNDSSILTACDSNSTLPLKRNSIDHNQNNQDCADESKGLNDDSSSENNNLMAVTKPNNDASLKTKRRCQKVKDGDPPATKKNVRQNVPIGSTNCGKDIMDITPPRRRGRRPRHLREEIIQEKCPMTQALDPSQQQEAHKVPEDIKVLEENAERGQSVKDPSCHSSTDLMHLKQDSKNNGMDLEVSVCAAHLTLNNRTVKEKLNIFVRNSIDRKSPSIHRKQVAMQNGMENLQSNSTSKSVAFTLDKLVLQKSTVVTLPCENSSIVARHDTQGGDSNIAKHPETFIGCLPAKHSQKRKPALPCRDEHLRKLAGQSLSRKSTPLQMHIQTGKNKETKEIGRLVREKLGMFVGSRKSKLNSEMKLTNEHICNKSSSKTEKLSNSAVICKPRMGRNSSQSPVAEICGSTDNVLGNFDNDKKKEIKAVKHSSCSGKIEINKCDTNPLVKTSVANKDTSGHSLRSCFVRLERCQMKLTSQSKKIIMDSNKIPSKSFTTSRKEQVASCQLTSEEDPSAKLVNHSEKQEGKKMERNLKEQIDIRNCSLNKLNSKTMFDIPETSMQRLECKRRQDMTSLEMKCVIPDSPKSIHKYTKKANKDIGGLKAVVQAESPRVADTLDTLAENPTRTIRHYAPSGSSFLDLTERYRSENMTEHAEAKVPIVPQVQDSGGYSELVLPLAANFESSTFERHKTLVIGPIKNSDCVATELQGNVCNEFLTYTRINHYKRKSSPGVKCLMSDVKTKKQKSTLLLSRYRTQALKNTRIPQPKINAGESCHQGEELPLDAVSNMTKHPTKEILDKESPSTGLYCQQLDGDCKASDGSPCFDPCKFHAASEVSHVATEDIQRLSSVSGGQQPTVAIHPQGNEKHLKILSHNRGFPRIRLKSHKSFKRKTLNSSYISVPLGPHGKARKECDCTSRKKDAAVNKNLLDVFPQMHTCKSKSGNIINVKKVSVEQEMTSSNSQTINFKSQHEDIRPTKYNVVACTKDVNKHRKKFSIKGKVPDVQLKSAKIVLSKLDDNTVEKLISAPCKLESGMLAESSYKSTKINFIPCVDGAVDSTDSDFSDESQQLDTPLQDSMSSSKFVGMSQKEEVHKEQDSVGTKGTSKHSKKLRYKPLAVVIKKSPSKKTEKTKLEIVKVPSSSSSRMPSKEAFSDTNLKDFLAVYLGSMFNKPATDLEIQKFLPVVLMKRLTPNILKTYKVDFTTESCDMKNKVEKSSQRAERRRQNSVDNCINKHCDKGSATGMCTPAQQNSLSGMKCESGNEHFHSSALNVVTKRKSRIVSKNINYICAGHVVKETDVNPEYFIETGHKGLLHWSGHREGFPAGNEQQEADVSLDSCQRNVANQNADSSVSDSGAIQVTTSSSISRCSQVCSSDSTSDSAQAREIGDQEQKSMQNTSRLPLKETEDIYQGCGKLLRNNWEDAVRSCNTSSLELQSRDVEGGSCKLFSELRYKEKHGEIHSNDCKLSDIFSRSNEAETCLESSQKIDQKLKSLKAYSNFQPFVDYVITLKKNPPTKELVAASLLDLNIPQHRFQEPFISNPADGNEFKEIGHKSLKVVQTSISNLQLFRTSLPEVSSLQECRHKSIQKMWENSSTCTQQPILQLGDTKEALSSQKETVITLCRNAPSVADVDLWARAKKAYKKFEANAMDEKQNDTCSFELTVPEGPCRDATGDFFSLTTVSQTPQGHNVPNSNKFISQDKSVPCTSSKLTELGCKMVESVEPKDIDYVVVRVGSTNEDEIKVNKNDGPSTQVATEKKEPNKKDTSVLHLLAQTQFQQEVTTPKVKHGSDLSSESLGYKMSYENLQDARSVEEAQNITLLCMELHIQTRGDLNPDPTYDPVCAVFYSVQNDVPDDSQVPQMHTGMIIVENVNRRNSPFILSTESDIRADYVPDEKSLIQKIVEIVCYWDPDILFGYEVEMLSWGYLFQRAFCLEVNLCSTISRVPSARQILTTIKPSEESFIEKADDTTLVGRIMLNGWRLMRHEAALQSYSFENVCYHVLHERIPHVTFRTLSNWWGHRTCLYWGRLSDYYLLRVKFLLRLLEQLDLINRTAELARIFGIQFYEVLSRGSQFRVESMMLRLAKPLNYVALSPSIQQRAQMRAPECLQLIMEPESKLYVDPVIVLDFQSLYPSMIIAYNYCFSTCLGRIEHLGKSAEFQFGCSQLRVPVNELQNLLGNINISPCGVAFVNSSVRKGLLPRMLEEILETRLMVKKSMKDHKGQKTLQRVLHSRQLGLKLIANVTYGYTAANFSGRMPCVEVGDSVVSKGRETLERAIHLVETTPRWGARVVYGDTDSLFVLVPGRNRQDAFAIGAEIAELVTQDNPQPVKLKLEKVYQPCLLQTKKRYVGYMYENPDQEHPVYDAKGIETVRRDGCPVVAKVLQRSLLTLFETKDVSLVKKYVQRAFSMLIEGRTSLQDLIFAREYRGSKGYKPGACVPALELTKRWLAADPRSEPRAGERVPYVIVSGAPNVPLIQLVRSPHEVLADAGLHIHAHYYISRVLCPPLARCFGLLGVDVHSWYSELPRRTHVSLPLYGPDIDNKKSTISQYFNTKNCALCHQISQKGICSECQKNPQRSSILLMEMLRHWERTDNHLVKVCQSCCRCSDKVVCVSLDCPIMYRRHVAQSCMRQETFLLSLLEEL